MSQTAWILAQLKQGPLTPLEALSGCGCFRLAARIAELREAGHQIKTENRKLPNGKVIAAYHLEEKESEAA